MPANMDSVIEQILKQTDIIAMFKRSLSAVKDPSERQLLVLQNSAHLLHDLLKQWTRLDSLDQEDSQTEHVKVSSVSPGSIPDGGQQTAQSSSNQTTSRAETVYENIIYESQAHRTRGSPYSQDHGESEKQSTSESKHESNQRDKHAPSNFSQRLKAASGHKAEPWWLSEGWRDRKGSQPSSLYKLFNGFGPRSRMRHETYAPAILYEYQLEWEVSPYDGIPCWRPETDGVTLHLVYNEDLGLILYYNPSTKSLLVGMGKNVGSS